MTPDECRRWLDAMWRESRTRSIPELEVMLETWCACVVSVAMGEWAARCDARHQSGYGPRDPSKPECNLHYDCADYDRVVLEMSGRIASHCYKPGCRLCR